MDNYFNIWWPFIKYSEKYKLWSCQILQHDLLQSVTVLKYAAEWKEKQSFCAEKKDGFHLSSLLCFSIHCYFRMITLVQGLFVV